MSLNLTVGPWALSVDFGKASEPADDPPERLTLSDGTYLIAVAESDAEAVAGFGFASVEAKR